MRIYALLLLGLLTLATGCVNNTAISTGDGIAINEFAADPTVAEINDDVRFYLDVENIGGTTAACVSSTLFGVDGWYDSLTGQSLSYPVMASLPSSGISFNINNNGADFCYWDITQGRQVCASYASGGGYSMSSFMGDSYLSYTNQFCSAASAYSGFGSTGTAAMLTQFTPALTPPLQNRNKAGQSWTAEWYLRPPPLPEGVRSDYVVTARTAFFYTSNALVNIRAFNKDEYKRRQINGDTSVNPAPLSIDNSYGAPIQLVVIKGDNPMIINQDPSLGGVEYFSYTFDLVNIGEGYPLPTSGYDIPGLQGPTGDSGYVWAVATINGPGAFFSNCLGQSGQEILLTPEVISLVKIRSNKHSPFGCQIGVDRSTWQGTPLGYVSITFEVFYRYYIDKEVIVTVIGPESF